MEKGHRTSSRHPSAGSRHRQRACQAKRRAGKSSSSAAFFIAVRISASFSVAKWAASPSKRLLDEALEVFPTRRIHDDIRVNAARRPVADFGPFTTALLPASDAEEEKAFHLGISGQAWLPLDWRGSREEPSWKEKLLEGLDPSLILADNTLLIDFLQGSDANMPPIARTQPAFIVLALIGNKALLSGQIAEPPRCTPGSSPL